MDAHTTVDMLAEPHAFAITVEHWRIDDVGQSGTDKGGMNFQRPENDPLARQRPIGTLVDLLVQFYRGALVARGDKAIHPGVAGAIEKIAHGFELAGIEHI